MPEPTPAVTTEVPQPRIIPGAPPKEAPSKAAAKRRRKAKAKGEATGANDDAPSTPVVESGAGTPAAPAHNELKPDLSLAPPTITREGSAAPGSAQAANSPLPDEEGGPLLSPIVELVNKRYKATTKKIVRVPILLRVIVPSLDRVAYTMDIH